MQVIGRRNARSAPTHGVRHLGHLDTPSPHPRPAHERQSVAFESTCTAARVGGAGCVTWYLSLGLLSLLRASVPKIQIVKLVGQRNEPSLDMLGGRRGPVCYCAAKVATTSTLLRLLLLQIPPVPSLLVPRAVLIGHACLPAADDRHELPACCNLFFLLQIIRARNIPYERSALLSTRPASQPPDRWGAAGTSHHLTSTRPLLPPFGAIPCGVTKVSLPAGAPRANGMSQAVPPSRPDFSLARPKSKQPSLPGLWPWPGSCSASGVGHIWACAFVRISLVRSPAGRVEGSRGRGAEGARAGGGDARDEMQGSVKIHPNVTGDTAGTCRLGIPFEISRVPPLLPRTHTDGCPLSSLEGLFLLGSLSCIPGPSRLGTQGAHPGKPSASPGKNPGNPKEPSTPSARSKRSQPGNSPLGSSDRQPASRSGSAGARCDCAQTRWRWRWRCAAGIMPRPASFGNMFPSPEAAIAHAMPAQNDHNE